ncbi:hypothetical protein Moror_5949 [Moniliophthora roreri MCA 2997]|uniref:Uncharacterized protein n=2 Tax=Moniliophthora roreri TaxID=221103 RepID=V2WYV4_MONRO|nr:hypothetical protein Moror_5949 [Moniliophthora roreri MCA 2997]KAI3614488.1 hypothetical protein WG66_009778 [Moniliophthora roreri]
MFNNTHGFRISGGNFNSVGGNQYNNGSKHYDNQDNRRYNNNNWGGTQNNNNGDGNQTNYNGNVPTYDGTNNVRRRERPPRKHRGDRNGRGDHSDYDDDDNEHIAQRQAPRKPQPSHRPSEPSQIHAEPYRDEARSSTPVHGLVPGKAFPSTPSPTNTIHSFPFSIWTILIIIFICLCVYLVGRVYLPIISRIL